jgi:hypothetical protein
MGCLRIKVETFSSKTMAIWLANIHRRNSRVWKYFSFGDATRSPNANLLAW